MSVHTKQVKVKERFYSGAKPEFHLRHRIPNYRCEIFSWVSSQKTKVLGRACFSAFLVFSVVSCERQCSDCGLFTRDICADRWTVVASQVQLTTYLVCGCSPCCRLAWASSRRSHGGRADNGIRALWYDPGGRWGHHRCCGSWAARRRCSMACMSEQWESPGRGCPRILNEIELVSTAENRCHSHSPFRERTYDCQNLAFLLGDSLRPIISKCCLNILAAVYSLFSLVRCKEQIYTPNQ